MAPYESDQSSSALNWGLDDQLELGGSLFDFAPPQRPVRKRDGRKEDFDANKVARSISRAAADIQLNDPDLARGIATGVTLYLAGLETNGPFESIEVHAAIERALIEMGYANVASAYVRFRERRDRLAELSGDLDRGDIERARAAGDLETDSTITVLNGDDTISPWNPSRIISSLMRETSLRSEEAHRVSADVERRIHALGYRKMTVGLIREIVGASLLELLGPSERAKHQRLGIPLFDAEQAINGGEEFRDNAMNNDPDATDRILAGRVKREFALSRVFSQHVGEAHRWGDLYINDLDSIDRLVSITATPEFVKLHGLPGRKAQGTLRARRADTLVAQMAGASVSFGRCLTGGFTWESVNWNLAPYLTDFDSGQIRDLARVLLFEFAYRRMVDPQAAKNVAIGVSWSLPQSLHDAPPVGPRGEICAESYAEYEAIAQRFAWALVELHREGSGDNPELRLPHLEVRIGPDCFLDQGFGKFLMHLSETAAAGNLTIRFSRESMLFAPLLDVSRPHESVANDITLNLARAARRSRTQEEFLSECMRLLELAAAGHVQKKVFLSHLLRTGSRGDGPLGVLGRRYGGAPWVSADSCVYRVSLTGYDEAEQLLRGQTGRGAGTAMDALRIRCADLSTELGLELRLAPATDPACRARLAELDLRYYPDSAVANPAPAGFPDALRYADPMAATRTAGGIEEFLKEGSERGRHFGPSSCLESPLWLRKANASEIAFAVQETYRKSVIPAVRFQP